MGEKQIWGTHQSPFGTLILTSDGKALTSAAFTDANEEVRPADRRDEASFTLVRRQLDEYFSHNRRGFDMELALKGTPFQRRVWDALLEIPYGETVSYGEIARRCGKPDAARPVGGAVGRNSITIIVPCHRVIGSDGTLTGYGAGLHRKRALLALERSREQ